MSIIETELEFQLPKNQSSQIKVMGVGGGGSNAVNYMFEHGIKGVDFVICNTDLQALEASPIPTKIQLGENLTEGLGAGSNPDVGMKAAQESADRINELLDANTKMLFITAGMGGGTGTGAAPVIAEIAREKGILTIAVVTHPFTNEGGYRKQYAKEGLEELKKQVDTLLIINNDKLIEVYGDLTLTQAFGKANEVLNTATKGIAEVISQHLLVNIDLNDARKVLENSGTAVMGQAQATGENRAIEAVTEALDSPLLNDNEIYGAEQVLLKIVTGSGDDEIKMSELSKIKNKIQSAAGRDVNIIEGIGIDPDLGSAVSVTVIATGFETKKVNDPITIDLESNEFSKDNEKIENDFTIETTNSSHVQQTLSLEEDSLQDHSETIAQSNLSNLKEKGFQIEETSVLVEEKIVLELEEEDLEEDSPVISLDLEEKIEAETEEVNSEEFISDILNSEDVEVKNASIDNETVLNSDTENLTTANSMRVEARERENRLREISIKLRTPSGLTKLENEPAYKRSNILLDDTTHSSEEELSRLSLNNEGLQSNNKFLHDNVD
jgi:cell division protein FtsZ|tara:strand:+ start:807 stop:2468 length:1662 start_codon:yes stop_codon:yes gene_type:complete